VTLVNAAPSRQKLAGLAYVEDRTEIDMDLDFTNEFSSVVNLKYSKLIGDGSTKQARVVRARVSRNVLISAVYLTRIKEYDDWKILFDNELKTYLGKLTVLLEFGSN
jgi:hypothetical protein